MDSTLKSFKATLYRGHFERGGSPLGEVQVNVEKLLHATKLNPVSNPQIDEHLVFGEKGEYFSVHLIEGKPNLDFIAQVAQPYKLSFLECRRRICPEPKKTQVLDSALPLKVAGEKSGNIPMEFK